MKDTVDNSPHPPSSWQPSGLITTFPLWIAYNAARDRTRAEDGKWFEPLEFEAVSFWEDMYHHVLLKSYANNFQIPSSNSQGDACDIVTRYYNSVTRKTFLFTEAKRANIIHKEQGILKLEDQLL